LLLTHFEDGARILGGGSVQTSPPGEGEGSTESYFVLELADGSVEVIFPSLWAKLCSYAFLRERGDTLVSALRLRALEWCKSAGLSSPDTWVAVPSAFRCAWKISSREMKLRDELREQGPAAGEWWGRS